MPPDICYLVRPGDRNEELRYSLRSLSKLPHSRVWVAGHCPSWLSDEVGRIPVPQRRAAWVNQRTNLAAACAHPEVGSEFVLFNDDFFVLRSVERMPVWHRGWLSRLTPRPGYQALVPATVEYLGHRARSYDFLHVPLPIVKEGMADVLADLPADVLFRTAYGHISQIGGRRHGDVKVRGDDIPRGAFASTNDASFARRAVGRHIRAMFPEPSRYER